MSGVLAWRGNGAGIAKMAAGSNTLYWALGISLLLHVIVLSLHFKFPDASRALQNKVLDIVLVNAKSARKPTDAQVLAQANLDGGGDSNQDRVAKTPLPPSKRQQSGGDLEQAQKKVQALEAQQRQLLAQAKAKQALAAAKENKEPGQAPPEQALPSGRDLANSALEMARLQGVIARQTEEYNKRPRRLPLGTRAAEFRFAQYMDDWQRKIERVGTLNYPEAARGKLSGSLMLTVHIRADGSVEKVEFDRSSGHRVFDDAARRIVRLAEPFAEFPADIKRDYDIISITRTWNFTSSNQLETK